MRRGAAARIAAAVLLALALLFGLAQLLLPRIAAARIRSRIGSYGSVESVSVSAWPAIKLLWGSADSVRVSAGALSLSEQRAESLIYEARHTARFSFQARSVKLGPLRVTDARLSKDGAQLHARGLASEADIRAALPAGVTGAQLLGSEGGQVRLRVEGSLFGVGASLDVVALASEGRLIVRPSSPLLGVLELTLLSDPHLYVEGVGASLVRAQPPSYELQLQMRLR